MNVEVTPELEKFVNERIENGDYKSPNEVVQEGLRLLRLRREKLEALRREIQIGIDDIEHGGFREYSSVEELFVDIEAAMAKRRKPSASQ
jgi:antitoxin ParD1/3/4